jgi:hypothetical protein
MANYGNIEQAFAGMKAEHYQYAEVLKSGCAKQAIDFGKPVFGYIGDENNVYNYFLDTALVIFADDFDSGDALSVTVNGNESATVTYATSHVNTMNLLVNAVKALGYDAAYGGSNNRTLYVRSKGETITVSVTQKLGTIPNSSITYQSDQVFKGLARHKAKEITYGSTSARYEIGDPISIVEKGFYYGVINNVNVQAGEVCYIDNSGVGIGNFTNVTGDDIGCKFRSNKITNAVLTDYLAVIELNGIKKINAEIAWA